MKNEITYTEHNGLYYPDLELPEQTNYPLGKYAILAYLIKYRKLNMKQLDHRRRLIDSFVNAIYLFDDYLVITFNYKEGTKTITFAEIEEAFGSDLSSLTAPEKSTLRRTFFNEINPLRDL